MGGWNIVYAIINFILLAGICFLIFRKSAAKIYQDHIEEIRDGMRRSESAKSGTGKTQERLKEIAAETDRKAGELLNEAEKKAAATSSERRSAAEQNADEYTREKGSLEEDFEPGLRRKLAGTAVSKTLEETVQIVRSESFAAERLALIKRQIAEFRQSFCMSRSMNSIIATRDVVHVTAETNEKLPVEERVDLRDAVAEKLPGVDVELTEIISPDFLGGIRIKVADMVYDGSLAVKLEQAEKELAAGVAEQSDLSEALKKTIQNIRTETEVYQMGKVISLSDGICLVSGISDAMAGEMVEFSNDLVGVVMDLHNETAGVVILGSYDGVQEGDEVRRTGHIIETPVGEAMLGRVVNALGKPIDGKGDIITPESRPIENPAPAIIERQPVSVPVQTGIMAIDALVPIGRGQRELLIGDRQTGKSAIALDMIINQRDKDMVCIYVAIGQKESTVAGIVEKLKAHGAMDYTIVVSAHASEPAPMLYVAPYTGTAIGEYFMHKGEDVLIVYDDLSKHAVSYREISLLLHRPPGREAYPGDVFYLHSRLLERSARLPKGSMTAIPIVETQEGDFSAYIPTNVISITDGQIYLESNLFNAGVRPAINAGLSVSRVGGSAQLKAMKQVSGRLRMELAQYRELAAFSQFGSDLDKSTRDTLNRGERMTEMLKQPQYRPRSVTEQVIAIFAFSKGYADDVDIPKVSEFEGKLITYVKANYPEIENLVMSGTPLTEEDMNHLETVIQQFKKECGQQTPE